MKKRRAQIEIAKDEHALFLKEIERQKKRLEQMQLRSIQRANRLQESLIKENKRADDRIKILIGAAAIESLKRGHAINWRNKESVLAELDVFLSRPAEREAVLAEDGAGSEAFHRVFMIKS
jgi:large subunit ribosomal protein L7/L12